MFIQICYQYLACKFLPARGERIHAWIIFFCPLAPRSSSWVSRDCFHMCNGQLAKSGQKVSDKATWISNASAKIWIIVSCKTFKGCHRLHGRDVWHMVPDPWDTIQNIGLKITQGSLVYSNLMKTGWCVKPCWHRDRAVPLQLDLTPDDTQATQVGAEIDQNKKQRLKIMTWQGACHIHDAFTRSSIAIDGAVPCKTDRWGLQMAGKNNNMKLHGSCVSMHRSGFGLWHIQSQSTTQDINPVDICLLTQVEKYCCS